jgi:hypothetical protein
MTLVPCLVPQSQLSHFRLLGEFAAVGWAMGSIDALSPSFPIVGSRTGAPTLGWTRQPSLDAQRPFLGMIQR